MARSYRSFVLAACAASMAVLPLAAFAVESAAPAVATPPAPVAQPHTAQSQLNATKSTTEMPYGYTLFSGQFSTDKGTGVNNDYKIQPGDDVTVSLWGITEGGETVDTKVDAQGMIFLPNIGPVKVSDVPQGELNQVVARHVAQYYRGGVQVYTSLRGAQGVSVFVAGGVVRPGRYSGGAADSLLHYLDQAFGIDADRGSYRRIDVLRGGTVLAQVDLYQFLMHGSIPAVQLKDNDVIFVHPLHHTTSVSGVVQNPYRFEFTTNNLTGAQLLEMARPLPGTSHAIVSGIRDGKGFANYLGLDALATTVLQHGDTVEFKSGTLTATMTVKIEGEHLGPQVIVAPADAHIKEVLRYVKVDRGLADITSVYLRRRSVADRQRQALQESLRRLEEAVIASAPRTETDAKMQSEEAKMVQAFVERAKTVDPEGRVVISEGGIVRDIALEDGDVIVIPRKTNLVMVNGEVVMPKAVVFKEGESVSYYVDRAGGYTERADEGRIVLARRNGETLANASDIRPGDEIIVMPEVSFSQLEMARDVVDILYKVAIAVAVPLRF